jgi:ATP-dependent DNA ligase
MIADAAARRPAVLVVFDVLELDGRDLRDEPLLKRREALHAAIPAVRGVKVIEHLETHGEALSLQVSMATTRGSSPSERTHPIGRTE